MHACDRQTDRILIARPRLHSMQRGKNVASLSALAWRITEREFSGISHWRGVFRFRNGNCRWICQIMDDLKKLVWLLIYVVTRLSVLSRNHGGLVVKKLKIPYRYYDHSHFTITFTTRQWRHVTSAHAMFELDTYPIFSRIVSKVNKQMASCRVYLAMNDPN